MATLITDTEKTAFKSSVADLFDTLKRDIIVYKEPIKNIVSFSEPLAGYSNTSAESTIEYTIVSGVYPAKIRHGRDQKNTVTNDTKTKLPAGTVRILVEQDCNDFIKQGRTESIVVDGLTFNQIDDEAPKDFLGKKYYVFMLNRTD